jgi:hypothetical protein
MLVGIANAYEIGSNRRSEARTEAVNNTGWRLRPCFSAAIAAAKGVTSAVVG